LPEISGHAADPPGRSVMIWIRSAMSTPSTPGWPRPQSLSAGGPRPSPGA
jgi:hypothetical protein